MVASRPVDENVAHAQLARHRFFRSLHAFHIQHIAGNGDRFPAGFPDVSCNLLSFFLCAV
ncbi:hypothetical protein D3C71_2163590 [compost metagenome]